jgi:hypothetical protein
MTCSLIIFFLAGYGTASLAVDCYRIIKSLVKD